MAIYRRDFVFESSQNSEITSFDELEKFTGVTILKEQAFDGCASLRSVDMRNLTSVERYAFRNCSSLAIEVYAPKLTGTLYYGTFTNSGITAIKELGSITKISSYDTSTGAIAGCNNLVSVELPNTLTGIGAHALKNNPNLTTINIPEGIRSVGEYTFYNCTSLIIDDLSLPNLETLGKGAFYGVRINKISNLGKITSIADETNTAQNFGDKTTLTEIVLPDTLTYIGNQMLRDYSSLVKCNIPSSVTYIGTAAFQNTSFSIENLSLPELTSLGQNAFYGVSIKNISNLGKITTTPDSSWQHEPFGKRDVLEKVILPDTLTSIGHYGFCGYTALKNITIPSGVTFLNNSTFEGCSSFEWVICKPTTPPTLGNGYCFDRTNDCPIYVPDESVEAYKTATNWTEYASRIKPISEYTE